MSWLEELYSLKPVSLFELSVQLHWMEVALKALPENPEGAVGTVSVVAVAVALLMSLLSWASVYEAEIVSLLEHSKVPLLLVAEPE